MSSVSANVTLRAPILSKDKYDKLFPHSEDKEQWLKATEFMTRYLSLSENQQLELKFEFEGMQAYFRNSKAYMARQKASGAISEELFEKINNYLNLVLENVPEAQPSPRP